MFEVEEDAHAALAAGPGEPRVGRLAPELLAEAGVVHDVVPVAGAGRGGEDRGEVEVGDAERVQVRDDLGGGVEAEAGVELEPVGGRGPRRHPLAARERLAEGAEELLRESDVRRRGHALNPSRSRARCGRRARGAATRRDPIRRSAVPPRWR